MSKAAGSREYAKHLRPHGKRAAAKVNRKANKRAAKGDE